MRPAVQAHSTASGTIELGGDGIVRYRPRPEFDGVIDGNEAELYYEALRDLCSGEHRPVLGIVPSVRMTREAMVVLSRREPQGCACALVVRGPVARIIGNFFVGVTPLPIPTRLFTDEAAAEAWLLSVSIPCQAALHA